MAPWNGVYPFQALILLRDPSVYATERRRLLMSLKAAVNSVLVKFVERQQPLTEEDAEALDLCYALESCLFHELKVQ